MNRGMMAAVLLLSAGALCATAAPLTAHADHADSYYDYNGYPRTQYQDYGSSYGGGGYYGASYRPTYYYDDDDYYSRDNRYYDDYDRRDNYDRYADRYDRDRYDDDRYQYDYDRERRFNGSLSVSRHDGLPGMRVTVAGSAFPRNDRITIYFGGKSAGTVYSDSRGTFQTVVHVPELREGLVYVTATGARGANPPTFYVEGRRYWY
jgi:hypothetical protein